MAVFIVGTLDTKGTEIRFAREILSSRGFDTRVIDGGSLGPPLFEPEISREEVFRNASTTSEAVRVAGNRGDAVAAAARGVTAILSRLDTQGEVDGVLGLGGSAGTVIATAAMRALPFGTPKVMISTLASGQTRPYVGGSDIMMISPIADLAGLNRLTCASLWNAANALTGMIERGRFRQPDRSDRPFVAATMFGVTTPCVDRARKTLENHGFEVVVFHATGVGGESMEGLIREGEMTGVLDLTTTELADELVGGILSAGPSRLEAAITARTPQVVSVGALDMVNFGPIATVPDRFAGRQFHIHNPSVTLMRTTLEENAMLGAWIARVLSKATVPVVVLIPVRGISALDAPGMPFFDPVADRALFDAMEYGLQNHPFARIEYRDEHINDPGFGEAAANTLLHLLNESTEHAKR